MKIDIVAAALLGTTMVATACGGGPGAGAPGTCVLEASDSVFLAAGPLYRDCAVDRPAKLSPASARIDFQPPPSAVQLGTTCFSAEVRLVVGPDGWVEPGTARLVRATDGAFGQVILLSAPSWRYRAAELGGRPVRQVVQEKRMMAVRVTVQGQGRSSAPPRC